MGEIQELTQRGEPLHRVSGQRHAIPPGYRQQRPGTDSTFQVDVQLDPRERHSNRLSPATRPRAGGGVLGSHASGPRRSAMTPVGGTT